MHFNCFSGTCCFLARTVHFSEERRDGEKARNRKIGLWPKEITRFCTKKRLTSELGDPQISELLIFHWFWCILWRDELQNAMFKSQVSIDSVQFYSVILRLHRSPRIAFCRFLLCSETPRLAVLRPPVTAKEARARTPQTLRIPGWERRG